MPPQIHALMPLFGLLTPPTLPLVLPTPLMASTIVFTIPPVMFTYAIVTPMLPEDPIAPLFVVDKKYEEFKSVIVALQLFVKKDTKTVEVMKGLHPLVESVYDKVLLVKYKKVDFYQIRWRW